MKRLHAHLCCSDFTGFASFYSALPHRPISKFFCRLNVTSERRLRTKKKKRNAHIWAFVQILWEKYRQDIQLRWDNPDLILVGLSAWQRFLFVRGVFNGGLCYIL